MIEYNFGVSIKRYLKSKRWTQMYLMNTWNNRVAYENDSLLFRMQEKR